MAACERPRRGTGTADDLKFLDEHIAAECKRLRQSKSEPNKPPARIPAFGYINGEFQPSGTLDDQR